MQPYHFMYYIIFQNFIGFIVMQNKLHYYIQIIIFMETFFNSSQPQWSISYKRWYCVTQCTYFHPGIFTTIITYFSREVFPPITSLMQMELEEDGRLIAVLRIMNNVSGQMDSIKLRSALPYSQPMELWNIQLFPDT